MQIALLFSMKPIPPISAASYRQYHSPEQQTGNFLAIANQEPDCQHQKNVDTTQSSVCDQRYNIAKTLVH